VEQLAGLHCTSELFPEVQFQTQAIKQPKILLILTNEREEVAVTSAFFVTWDKERHFVLQGVSCDMAPYTGSRGTRTREVCTRSLTDSVTERVPASVPL
jgi:hypothetical protein